jgi:hypothetical protein
MVGLGVVEVRSWENLGRDAAETGFGKLALKRIA